MTFTVNVCKEVIDDDVPPSKLSRYINERHTLEILDFEIWVVVRHVVLFIQKTNLTYTTKQGSRVSC